MQEIEVTYTITISQPSLGLNATQDSDISITDKIIFGRWLKGDKGDPGSGADYDLATNEDIDNLFD